MNREHEFENEPGLAAEETLRRVAQLPPPEGLNERVHRRIDLAQEPPARRGFWSLWMPARRLQFAAAAVLVVAVAGSTWGVYHGRREPGAQPSSQSGTGTQVAAPAPNGGAAGDSGGFGTANARHVPPTLNPIKVPSPPKKKPNASHAAKPSAKKLAAPASAAETGAEPKPER